MRPENVVNRFLKDYLSDRVAGRDLPVEEYLARFPGFELEVREAHAAIGVASSSSGAKTDRARTPIAPAPGDRFGPYTITREIGHGGQGIVYDAEDRRLTRRVALKVLSGVGALSPEARERFLREARVASRLDHPGICTVFETGIEGPVPFIAMRYVEGETLDRRISALRRSRAASNGSSPDSASHPTAGGTSGASRRAEVLASVRLIEKVARALHAAHEAGVIHRDVKPRNIMVSADGDPVLLDFGMARDLDPEQPSLTQGGDIFGTPAYMSPEQLSAGTERLDERTDVWSLGVTLYELVTGRRPFEAPTAVALQNAIRTQTPVDPQRLDSAVSSDLKVVIETAIAKERSQRYQSAEALADDLLALAERRPIAARPVSAVTKVQRWMRREPVLATTVALGVVAAVAVGLLVYFRGRASVRSEALRLLADADRLAKDYEAARASFGPLLERIERLNDGMPWDAPTDDDRKRSLIQAREDREKTVRRAEELSVRTELAYAAARAVKDLPEIEDAHLRFLCALYKAAEADGNDSAGIRLRAQLEGTQAAAVLDPFGTITLATDPPKAAVTAYRYVKGSGGCLVEDREHGVVLGATPLASARIRTGSYVLVISAPGRRDTRYPVLIERDQEYRTRGDVAIRLFDEEAIGGSGWVYVPGGWTLTGGDSHAESGERRIRRWIDGIFLMRYEVTNAEYTEFLRDPEIAAEIERSWQGGAGNLMLVPRRSAKEPVWSRTAEGSWSCSGLCGKPESESADIPVAWVSWIDAMRFASWRSVRDRRTYRLPTEWEWERAARGADARFFPWGDSFDWSYMCGFRSCPDPSVQPIGRFAEDESPFLVRDIAGSRREWCSNQCELETDTMNGSRQARGGSCGGGSVSDFRCAQRYGGAPTDNNPFLGIRLACEL